VTSRAPHDRAAGFTLLELLIALSIVGVLLAIAFGGLRMGVVAWARGEDRVEVQQHARSLNQILVRTLGATSPYKGAFGEGPEKRLLFKGDRRQVQFVTQFPAFPTAVGAAFTAVVIGFEDDAQGRALVVRQRIMPNREPFAKAEVVLRDPAIQDLEIAYLGDEGGWSESWETEGDNPKLPSAIRIRFSTSRGGRVEPSPPITVTLRVIE
jgi:general secretion pathway protein J